MSTEPGPVDDLLHDSHESAPEATEAAVLRHLERHPEVVRRWLLEHASVARVLVKSAAPWADGLRRPLLDADDFVAQVVQTDSGRWYYFVYPRGEGQKADISGVRDTEREAKAMADGHLERDGWVLEGGAVTVEVAP